MNPPVPPEPEPPGPGPGPDPPTPVTTYNFTAAISYGSSSEAGIDYTLTLSYKEEAESEWEQIDSAVLTSQASGGTSTAVLRNIPEGCHSVKVEISVRGAYVALIKNAGSSWVTYLTYGSGNEGWNQDYESNIEVIVAEK